MVVMCSGIPLDGLLVWLREYPETGLVYFFVASVDTSGHLLKYTTGVTDCGVLTADALLKHISLISVALYPGHSQILSRSHGEKSGEALGSLVYVYCTSRTGNGGLSLY